MVNEKLNESEEKILKFYYVKWFENYIGKFTSDDLIPEFENITLNQIKMYLMNLDPFFISTGLINKNLGYTITELGINYYENKNPIECKQNIEEKQKILEHLDESFIKDVDKTIDSESLESVFFNTDKMHMLAQMTYLKNMNFIVLNPFMGGSFRTSLTIHGHNFLQE